MTCFTISQPIESTLYTVGLTPLSTTPPTVHSRRELVDAAKSIKKRRYQLMTNTNFQLALVKFASKEGLLGKAALPRRVSSPSSYPGSPVPSDEFSVARWTFGAKGKPAVLFFHGTFAPVYVCWHLACVCGGGSVGVCVGCHLLLL